MSFARLHVFPNGARYRLVSVKSKVTRGPLVWLRECEDIDAASTLSRKERSPLAAKLTFERDSVVIKTTGELQVREVHPFQVIRGVRHGGADGTGSGDRLIELVIKMPIGNRTLFRIFEAESAESAKLWYKFLDDRIDQFWRVKRGEQGVPSPVTPPGTSEFAETTVGGDGRDPAPLPLVLDRSIHSFLMRSMDETLTTTYCTCMTWWRKCTTPEMLALVRKAAVADDTNRASPSKSGDEGFICPQCHRRFSSASTLVSHCSHDGLCLSCQHRARRVLYEPVAIVVFNSTPRYRSYQQLLARLPVGLLFRRSVAPVQIRKVLRAAHMIMESAANFGSVFVGMSLLKDVLLVDEAVDADEIERSRLMSLLEPLQFQLQRFATRIATGGHLWVSQASENRLRKRSSSSSINHEGALFANKETASIHCRLCKLPRDEGYLAAAFESAISEKAFVGEFTSAQEACSMSPHGGASSPKPGFAFVLWCILCKLQRSSARFVDMCTDHFQPIVIAQTFSRICSCLIGDTDSDHPKVIKTCRKPMPLRCRMALPSTDLSFDRVFEAVTPNAIVALFACLLCDAKVVVMSRHAWKLNDVLEVAIALTYPLSTTFALPVYQTLLPFDAWQEITESPYNFVLGTLLPSSSALRRTDSNTLWEEGEAPPRELCDKYESTVIIDIDVLDVDVIESHLKVELKKANVPPLPPKYRKRLRRAFAATYVWASPIEESTSTKSKMAVDHWQYEVDTTDEEDESNFSRPLVAPRVVPKESDVGSAISNTNSAAKRVTNQLTIVDETEEVLDDEDRSPLPQTLALESGLERRFRIDEEILQTVHRGGKQNRSSFADVRVEKLRYTGRSKRRLSTKQAKRISQYTRSAYHDAEKKIAECVAADANSFSYHTS
eukprot:g4948.t1